MLSGARRTGETGGHTPRKTNSREDNALKHFARPMLLSPLCVAACFEPAARPMLRYLSIRNREPGYLFGAGKARLKIDRLPITSRKTREPHAPARNSMSADSRGIRATIPIQGTRNINESLRRASSRRSKVGLFESRGLGLLGIQSCTLHGIIRFAYCGEKHL